MSIVECDEPARGEAAIVLARLPHGCGGGVPSGMSLFSRRQQRSRAKVGDSKMNPKDGLRYVWIPPGRVTAGCSPGDKECYEDENPSSQRHAYPRILAGSNGSDPSRLRESHGIQSQRFSG